MLLPIFVSINKLLKAILLAWVIGTPAAGAVREQHRKELAP